MENRRVRNSWMNGKALNWTTELSFFSRLQSVSHFNELKTTWKGSHGHETWHFNRTLTCIAINYKKLQLKAFINYKKHSRFIFVAVKFSQNFRLARFTFLFLIFIPTLCLQLSKNYFIPPSRLPFIFITKCLFVRKGKLRRVCSLLLFTTSFLFPSPPSSLHHQDWSGKLKV